MKRRLALFALMSAAFCCSVQTAFAQSQTGHEQTLSDSTRKVSLEQVQRVAGQLMAPCCWSGTADAHTSQIAYDMRVQIREALAQGKSTEEILQAYVEMYGERILAKPTKSGFNLLAWLLPFVALVVGGFAMWRFLHRNTAPVKAPIATTEANDPYLQRVEKELKEFEA
ncbi:cytochrome c-type biogenesis protein CcmH [candidate division KSB1 bacterium]|nr:cytochrome c-type biogenesis protein CcmH [candidate division KSB1 bacterium]